MISSVWAAWSHMRVLCWGWNMEDENRDSSNKVGQACSTEHPLLSQALGLTHALRRPHLDQNSNSPALCFFDPRKWSKEEETDRVRWVESKTNRYKSLSIYCIKWTHEDNMVGELLWYAVVVVVLGGLIDLTKPTWRQTNKATIHVPSPVIENVFPPDAKNRPRGKSAKTTDRERSLPLWIRICFLWATFTSPHGRKEPGICTTECRAGRKWKARSYSSVGRGIVWPWRPGGPVLDPGVAQPAAGITE